jgi:hypothetical protein
MSFSLHRLSARAVGVILALAGCERAAPEPAPSPRIAEVHATPTDATSTDAATTDAATSADPPGEAPRHAPSPDTTENPACALLPERAVRALAGLSPERSLEREPTGLAGLFSCRYRWRKPDARAIEARNAERATRDPSLLAAVAGRGRAGPSTLESPWSELRVSVFPPRSGTEALWARGFSLAHPGEVPVPGVGDQGSYHRERRTLSVRKGARTLEVLARTTEDPDASLALARRVALDALSRM